LILIFLFLSTQKKIQISLKTQDFTLSDSNFSYQDQLVDAEEVVWLSGELFHPSQAEARS
jgi:hypothetical protein